MLVVPPFWGCWPVCGLVFLVCVGVVCELDSVLFFVLFMPVFLFLSLFGWDAGAFVVLVFWALTFVFLFGEFDPGSGRTLAACLTHASRTDRLLCLRGGLVSGERVSNT